MPPGIVSPNTYPRRMNVILAEVTRYFVANDSYEDDFPSARHSKHFLSFFRFKPATFIRYTDNHEAYVRLDDKVSACNTHQKTVITDIYFVYFIVNQILIKRVMYNASDNNNVRQYGTSVG